MGVDAAEADALPRSMKNRPVDRGGGVIYMYKPAVTRRALEVVGGMEGRCRRLAECARVASSSINLRDTARGLDCCMPGSKRVAGHYSSVKPPRGPRASGWWLWWLGVAAP